MTIAAKQSEIESALLKQAVLEYLSECDNPVPDYMFRWNLRNRLRVLTGAPPAPTKRHS